MHTVPASLEVVVSLVKVAELTIHGKSYIKEYHIADGENTDKEFLQHRRDGTGAAVLEGGTVIIQGSCLAGTEGSEMSWKVEKVACVKVSILFKLCPVRISFDNNVLIDAFSLGLNLLITMQFDLYNSTIYVLWLSLRRKPLNLRHGRILYPRLNVPSMLN